MSSTRFDLIVKVIFGREGGKADDPSDHGGPTNMGITHVTLREAIRRGIVRPDATINNLRREEAKNIYFVMFWAETKANLFPPPLDLLAFDAFVQHRPKPASILMQKAVSAVPDGIIGPATLRLAGIAELEGAVRRYSKARALFYEDIVEQDRTQAKFLRGWLLRNEHITNLALKELAA